MNYRAEAIDQIAAIVEDTDLPVSGVILSVLISLRKMGYDINNLGTLVDVDDKELYRAANAAYKREVDE